MAKKELQDNPDFTFVQMDKTIHDLKFQTKPTTYFKDAFKRFRKNKSSVAAGIIIGILTTMSILVPVFNNSIGWSNNQEPS
jgi:oligopeptide transport system permease protein